MPAYTHEPNASDILHAAARAYDDLNSNGWGEVYIMFSDANGDTQAVMYVAPIEDKEDAEESVHMCFEEIQDCLELGWRPLCLQVLPYAEGTIVPLREDLTVEDQAAIWELSGESTDTVEEIDGIKLAVDLG